MEHFFDVGQLQESFFILCFNALRVPYALVLDVIAKSEGRKFLTYLYVS
jgi:hypothetical protein